MIEIVLAAEEGSHTNPFLPADYDIIWSLIPFAVIVGFFWLFAVPRFRKILDDRASAIEGGIAKAEVAQAEAAVALEQYTLQLAEGRAEASRIREQARADAQKISLELREQAQADIARMQSQASVQIEAERQAAVLSLRSEVGTLALDLASTVIGESVKDDQKAAGIVDRFLADLEASEASASGAGNR
jgi:F-type H+-transporting ATPase subunit b